MKFGTQSVPTVIGERGEMTFIQREWIEWIVVKYDGDKQLPELVTRLYKCCFFET